MLDAALAEYKNKTGNDLLAHGLATELQNCESADAVLDVLRNQAKTFEQSGDQIYQRLMKWIDPVDHVYDTIYTPLVAGVSLAHPRAKSIVAVIGKGIGGLLAAAKDVKAKRAAIADLFQRLESFFKRLEDYTQTSLTTKMAEVLVKIVVELLPILSIATKEAKRPLAKGLFRKRLGRTDIEDALKRLESLLQEEDRMATAQNLKVATEAKGSIDRSPRSQ